MDRIEIRLGDDLEIEGARSVLATAYRQYERAFPPQNWASYLSDILDLEGRADVSDLLVAVRDGNVIACVSYYPPGAEMSYPSESFSEQWPAEWAAIRLLAVHPEARGEGLGRRLTESCIERARSQRAVVMGLHTTTQMSVAREMYERMGFTRAPRYDFRPGGEVLVEAYQLPLQ